MTTTPAVSRSTTGLRAALLNKVAADSGHVAPGVDVFSAFRFTRQVFRIEAVYAEQARQAHDDWEDQVAAWAAFQVAEDQYDEYYEGTADSYEEYYGTEDYGDR